MSLIKCLECNNEISDMAKICPKCGIKVKIRPVSKNNSQAFSSVFLKFCLIFFVGGFIIKGILESFGVQTNTIETTKQETKNNTPQIGQVSTIKRLSLGAYNLDDFNQAVTYISQGDNQAFYSLKNSGKVFDLKPNQQVFIIDAKIFSLQFKVRFVGQTQTFWYNISAFK